MSEPQGRRAGEISDLLVEDRRLEPSADFRRLAYVQTDAVRSQSWADPEGFWDRAARDLDWFQPWQKVCEWTPPHAKWFVGGKINACYNCLDRHILAGQRNKAAIIWEGEPGDSRVLTYGEPSLFMRAIGTDKSHPAQRKLCTDDGKTIDTDTGELTDTPAAETADERQRGAAPTA